MPRNPYKDRTCNLCRHCQILPTAKKDDYINIEDYGKQRFLSQKEVDKEKLKAFSVAFREAYEVFFKKAHDLIEKGVL